jgi:GTP-sensing pleiotropic transcriptional regulator CodY
MSRIHNTASYVVIGLVPIELGEIGLGAFSISKTDRDFSEPSLIMVSNEMLPSGFLFNRW